MADIIDPLVVSWDNTRARTIADKMTTMLAQLQAYQADYAAFAINAAIVADGNTNKIADGYAVDGRAAITGLQIQNLKAGIDALVVAWNVTLVVGVGATVQSMQQAIQVNGSQR